MAGYIFNMDSEESIQECFLSGTYKTALNHEWTSATDGTFADYLGMKSGDNIYFFRKRKIYGIGRLIDHEPVFACFPDASVPGHAPTEVTQNGRIFRWGCFFDANPRFFREGVDMDDVLLSAPDSFTMLRAFWKVSFIKIDDIENQALKNVILYRNRDVLLEPHKIEEGDVFQRNDASFEENIRTYTLRTIAPIPFLRWACDGDVFRREMALECAMMWDLSRGNASEIFGRWDYVSHQVMASPFKPIDYMDKMDIFGYQYIPGFKPTILNYKVCELKRGIAGENEVRQCMKYVDWIRDKYAYGDYSMIKAFLVASDFELNAGWRECTKRNYVSGFRDLRTPCWNEIKLIKYRYDSENNMVVYSDVTED